MPASCSMLSQDIPFHARRLGFADMASIITGERDRSHIPTLSNLASMQQELGTDALNLVGQLNSALCFRCDGRRASKGGRDFARGCLLRPSFACSCRFCPFQKGWGAMLL